jgi:hypothetical protein
MENIILLLFTIGKISLLGSAFSLCIFLLFALKDKKVNSSLISMTVLVLTNAMMRWYAPYLLALKTTLAPSLLPYIIFSWYMGFAMINTFSIYMLSRLHLAFTIRYSIIGKMVIVGYFIQAQLQLIRYSERLLLGPDSQYLQSVYQAGISAVNIGMAGLSLCFAIGIAISRYRINQGKGGLQWIL